jgi:hypothetical protein
MSSVQAFRPAGTSHEQLPDSGGGAPLVDPYLNHVAAPPPRSEVSWLAISSLVALFFGPIGAMIAIVLGFAARRETGQSVSRRHYRGIATAGVALGTVALVGWGVYLGFYLWMLRPRLSEASVAVLPVKVSAATPSGSASAEAPEAPPSAAPSAGTPGDNVPKNNVVRRNGAVTVIEVGRSVAALDQELAKQRAEAATVGETLMVMTSQSIECQECLDVLTSFRDPLMQAALSKVRIIQVDVRVFDEDLVQLKIPSNRIPSFFLLSPDLTPRDGIDAGEWDDNIAVNIAPVLGAFLRGKYNARRQRWQPLKGTGVSL